MSYDANKGMKSGQWCYRPEQRRQIPNSQKLLHAGAYVYNDPLPVATSAAVQIATGLYSTILSPEMGLLIIHNVSPNSVAIDKLGI